MKDAEFLQFIGERYGPVKAVSMKFSIAMPHASGALTEVLLVELLSGDLAAFICNDGRLTPLSQEQLACRIQQCERDLRFLKHMASQVTK